ncbi:MAG: Type 1 glutamine amidotransferase-like domain-containing protein [Ilumatobacter sp.]
MNSDSVRDTAGLICLQGGREFTPACEAMDRLVLDRVATDAGVPTVAVLAGAARVGSDYAGASARAGNHYEQLGATVVAVPDPRTDLSAAFDELAASFDLLVLPGGSPSGLLDVLTGRIGDLVLERHRRGLAISGASAGAMVLCSQLVLPDRGGDVVAGLGLVGGLALPHWSPGSSRGWTLPDIDLWGLPECGGALIDAGSVTAVGAGEPAVQRNGEWTTLPR